MNRFIDITYGNNLSLLDKKYNPDTDETPSKIPSEVFINIWAEIQMEFTDEMDMGTLKDNMSKKIQIDAMTNRYAMIQSIILLLNQTHNEELVDILKDCGYNMPFDPKDELRYKKDLKKVQSLSKSILAKRAILEAELKHFAPQETGEAKTLDDWEEDKIQLDNEAKMAINWDVKPVSEYIKRYKGLIKKYKAQAQKTKKNVRLDK